MRFIFYSLLCLIPMKAFSFNWDRCSKKWIDTSSWLGEGWFTSSSSYLSSTGECSALGMVKEDQAKLFYAFNNDKVLNDVARGTGEHYLALSEMWGCSEKSALNEVSSLRENYLELVHSELGTQYSMMKDKLKCSQVNKTK